MTARRYFKLLVWIPFIAAAITAVAVRAYWGYWVLPPSKGGLHWFVLIGSAVGLFGAWAIVGIALMVRITLRRLMPRSIVAA